MNYTCLRINLSPYNPWSEIVVAELASLGFESFEEKKTEVLAYIPESDFAPEILENTIVMNPPNELQVEYSIVQIPSENWNANWEADYAPVTIGNQLIIAAPFHEIAEDYKYSVTIQPQTSFGTGHHQTTHLIAAFLLTLDLKEKIVFDIGTGTGVLAILSEKMGADHIIGTEIDDGSYINAVENCQINHCRKVELFKDDIQVLDGKVADLVIANINRNILLNHLPYYQRNVKCNGFLVLSGFFVNDNENLIKAAENCNFTLTLEKEREGWSMLVFKKSA